MEKDLSVNLCSKQLTGARGRLMMSKIVVVAVACAVSSVVFAAADKASNGSAEQKAASAPTPAQKASALTAVQKAAVPTPAQKVPAPAQKVSSPTQKEPATAQKPPEQQVSGRFTRTRLAPLTAKGRPNQTLSGRVVATFSSDQTRVKRPVLYIAALYDVDGMWRMYDVICSTPEVWYGHLLSQSQTPAQVSKWQMEISKDACNTVTFGDLRVGFFNDCGISSSRAKLIGYRLELWQNGGLVKSFDSAAHVVRRAGAPEDWHVKGKYPGKIVYRWPPPPPAK